MADWSGIPEELLSLICQRLDSFVDYLQFKVVCKSWRCVSYNYPLLQLPLLMLPQENTSSTSRRSFLGLTRGGEELDKTKVYELDLPEIHRHRCVGAAGNWIVTVDMELDMHIFNLFSKVHMNLPPQSTFDTQFQDQTKTRTQLRDLMVSKVVLTSMYPNDPSKDCIAVAIYSLRMKIAIARPGDKTWITIQNIFSVKDIIYFKEKLYGITPNNNLCICDIKSDPPKASEMHVSYSSLTGVFNRYLVEWSGELLQVIRQESRKRFCTTYRMDVFKFDLASNKWRLVEILGEHALFLGFNSSVSVLASDSTIFKRNCIYFTEDYHLKYYGTNLDIEIPFDMGVFNLEDKKIRPFSSNTTLASPFSPPVWIISKLHG